MESPIEHIVVLMLENRSFDHVLGALAFEQEDLPDDRRIDGLKPDMANDAKDGTRIRVHPAATAAIEPDPLHEFENVQSQIAGGAMDGFVRDYENALEDRYPITHRAQVMSYLTSEMLPVTYALAREYAVSDRWFASVPSATIPNRLFAHCGSSGGHIHNPTPWSFDFYDLDTVYRRLGEEWVIYNDNLPLSIVVRSLAGEFLSFRHGPGARYRSLEQFRRDCETRLPKYSFIEPVYAFNWFEQQNDDHPPALVDPGQELIADVYLTLRSSRFWPSTVLVVTYDEHGGFFDHRAPPNDVPAPHLESPSQGTGFDFTSLGVRVPTLVISAYTPRGYVLRPPQGAFLDHSTLIASAADRFGFERFTDRIRGAATFWDAVSVSDPRADDQATVDLIAAELTSLRARGRTQVDEFGSLVGLDGRTAAARFAEAHNRLEDRGEELNDIQRLLREAAEALPAF